MSDEAFVRRFEASSNFRYCKRIIRALKSGIERRLSTDLAYEGNVTLKKFYVLMKDIKIYLRITEDAGVHNLPGVGYVIARNISQRLDEVGKSQLRGIAHLTSAANSLKPIKPENIKNPDEMEAYGQYTALNALATAMKSMEPTLKRLMGDTAKKHHEELKEQVKTPFKLIGLEDISKFDNEDDSDDGEGSSSPAIPA